MGQHFVRLQEGSARQTAQMLRDWLHSSIGVAVVVARAPKGMIVTGKNTHPRVLSTFGMGAGGPGCRGSLGGAGGVAVGGTL